MDAKEKYFLWNDAFVNHFFNQGKDIVKLYIDEDVINEVGKTLDNIYDNDETYNHELISKSVGQFDWLGGSIHVARFVDAVLVNYDNRRYFPKTKGSCADYPMISELAVRLSSFKKGYCHDVPCLSFVLLILFLFKQSGYRDGQINPTVYQYLHNFKNDNRTLSNEIDLRLIPNLFDAIKASRPALDVRKFGQQPFVSYLRYQLMPTPAQRRQIEYALYRAKSLDSLSYGEKISRLIPYVDDKLKTVLKSSLNDEITKRCILNIIDNFSLSNYQRGSGKSLSSFEVIYAIELGEDESDDRLIMLTDFNESDVENENYKILRGDTGLIAWKYNPNPVQCRCGEEYTENVVLGTTILRFNIDDSFVFQGQKYQDVVFFQKYGERYLQSRELVPDAETIVIVRNKQKSIEKWENWASNNILLCQENNYWATIQGLGNEQWKAYIAKGFKTQYYNDTVNICQSNQNDGFIEMDGGIGINNCYLQNALPSFIFSEQIVEDRLSVTIGIDNKEPTFDRLINGKRLVLDLLDFQAQDTQSELQMLIEYTTENGTKLEERFEFQVQAQNVRYNSANLYKYNKWGNILDDGSTEEYLAGSRLHHPISKHNASYDFAGIKAVRDISEFDQCYFINLLSAYYYLKQVKHLNRDVVLKCLKYAANRQELQVTEDDFWHIRRVLVNSSYVAYDRNQSTYQVLPPSFVRLPRNKADRPLYVLTGCYTYGFISELWNYLKQANHWREDLRDFNRPFMYVRENVEYYHDIDKVMPELFIFEEFNFEDFKVRCNQNCEVLDHDIAYDLLNFSPTVIDYQATLSSRGHNDGTLDFKDCSVQTYPRVRVSKAKGYHRYSYIEMPNTDLQTSSVADEAWMQIYCKYIEDGARSFMVDGVEDDHLVRFYFPYKLPYILHRALYLINVGQPKTQKAFICNNSVTSDVLYTVSKSYVVDACYRDRIAEILTGKPFHENPKIGVGRSVRGAFRIESWKIKTVENGKPRNILALFYQGNIIAYGTGSNEAFVEHYGTYQKVEGSVNEVFSRIILSDKNYRMLFEDFKDKTLNVSGDLYETEPINIIS